MFTFVPTCLTPGLFLFRCTGLGCCRPRELGERERKEREEVELKRRKRRRRRNVGSFAMLVREETKCMKTTNLRTEHRLHSNLSKLVKATLLERTETGAGGKLFQTSLLSSF